MKREENVIQFELELLSDGEPGTGRGNETINSFVTKDHDGNPVIRASHLKGLIRMNLVALSACRSWSSDLANWCCGSENAEGPDGEGQFKLSDARMAAGGAMKTISRTALSALGTAHSGSLRTVECVSAGTIYKGTMRFPRFNTPEIAMDAVRLALLMIDSVGGGRTRGAGRCRVTVAGEGRKPGVILRKLDEALRSGDLLVQPNQAKPSQVAPTGGGDGNVVLLQLRFVAEDPICCPELPVVRNNVIVSGMGIPASAVLGAVISRLAEINPQLADESLFDRRTRFWPLLPCGVDTVTGTALGHPVRVSLSHRMSKLPDDAGNHDFKDPALEPFDWREVAQGSPLKGSDGVLIRDNENKVLLWRSGDMPRIVSAHAVINNRRNLFTVESQAPMVYEGWLCLPENAATALSERLHKNSYVCFGKARTVRGGGHLYVDEKTTEGLFEQWCQNVFVLQSPAAIPDEWNFYGDAGDIQSAEQVLAKLLADSGWGEMMPQDRQASEVSVTSQGRCAVRFGWNRHGVGVGVDHTRRLRARRVFLPGTVFQLKQRPQNLWELLQRGLGVERQGDIDGRCQGFGAVLPHPGVARELFTRDPKPKAMQSDETGHLAFEWFQQAKGANPTPSQISSLAARLKGETPEAAISYLKGQLERPEKVFQRWKNISKSLTNEMRSNPRRAESALRAYADLVNAQGKQEGGR